MFMSTTNQIILFIFYTIIQICSGITRGRELSGELYAQSLQKLIYLHLSTDCYLQSTGLEGNLYEIVFLTHLINLAL